MNTIDDSFVIANRITKPRFVEVLKREWSNENFLVEQGTTILPILLRKTPAELLMRKTARIINRKSVTKELFPMSMISYLY